jgi:hypothetical protein
VSAPTPFNLTNLELDGLIVHEIMKGSPRHDPEVKAELSSKEAPADVGTLDFLGLQLRNGMTEYGVPAELVDTDGGAAKVIALIEEHLLGTGPISNAAVAGVVHRSRELAERLQIVQEHNSPAGMFAVCRGRMRGGPTVAIMKLESQRGLQLIRGDDFFSLQVNRDLFVGNKARLFKAAMFWRDGRNVRIMVCDEQMGGTAPHPAADFFVRALLGCSIDDNAKVRTAKFFEVATKAIKLVEEPEDRDQVLDAIRHEIVRNTRNIDPIEFIADNFPQDKQAAVTQFFERSDIDVNHRFHKDVSSTEYRFKRTTYRFDEGGPSVIAADAVVKRIGRDEDFDPNFRGVQLRYVGDEATMFIRGVVNEVKPRS